MKVSELIEKLKVYQDTFGDLDVKYKQVEINSVVGAFQEGKNVVRLNTVYKFESDYDY